MLGVRRLLPEKSIASNTQLNIAVTDGKQAGRHVRENGVGRMVDFDVYTDTVIIASEPLSDDPRWEALEPNSMILVGPDRQISAVRRQARGR